MVNSNNLQHVPHVNQQANFQIRPQQFNQQFHQPPLPKVSPLMAQPLQYNPQIPPCYFSQYPPANNPSVGSNESLLARVFHRQMDMVERQERHDIERDEREKRNKRSKRKEKLTKEPASTRLSRRSIVLMVPTPIDVYNG